MRNLGIRDWYERRWIARYVPFYGGPTLILFAVTMFLALRWGSGH